MESLFLIHIHYNNGLSSPGAMQQCKETSYFSLLMSVQPPRHNRPKEQELNNACQSQGLQGSTFHHIHLSYALSGASDLQ